jgi:hypothetical protein
MLTYILIAIAAVAGLVILVAAMQPAAFRITRTARLAASPEAIFAEVNDFHRWRAWSPYEKLDPSMTRTFEGPAAGRGAVYRWAGNSNVGEGACTIVESCPHELIKIRLEMVKPFAADNDVEFTFQPEGDQMAVSWSMAGRRNFFFKLVGLFMNMDKMCGGQFEEGLANLRSIVEAAPGAAAPALATG